MEREIETRPDPDALLQEIRQQESAGRRGRLKIFFGYAAGVGKTYAMLDDAHSAKKQGVDVVVGYIEPHTRPETMERLEGLELLPQKEIAYKNITLKEFDLDAALSRKPQLILVDELAHSNAEGLRHTKRYSDIEELLDAGIDVYTTVNVQHIESLNDLVASITNVVVKERVPDSIFEEAAQIELIDIEPDELINRLSKGKIYKERQARRALVNFFTADNLVALREISLRYTADKVYKEREIRKGGRGIGAQVSVGEHLLICLSSSPTNQKVIRTAARMAAAFHANFTAIYVETPEMSRFSEARKKSLRDNIKLAESLGAKITSTYSDDAPYQIAEFARVSGVTKVIVGRARGRKRAWGKYFQKPNFVDRLIHLAPEIEIFVIPDQDVNPVAKELINKKYQLTFADICKMLLIMAGATLIGVLFHEIGLRESNIIILFILGVLITANQTSGRLYGAIASLIAVLSFNFFFTDPRFTFQSGAEYPITFAVMLAAAFITSTLTSRAKSQAIASAINAYRTDILLETNNKLQKAETMEEILIQAERQIYKVLKKPLIFYTVREGQIENIFSYASDDERAVDSIYIDREEQAVAAWVIKHKKRAGRGTDTLPGAKACYLPIRGQEEVLAVLGVVLAVGEEMENEDKSLLAAILGQVAFALEKYLLNEKKNAAAMQAESERFKANLLRAVSHDLRTPLTSISGSASSLLSTEFDERTRRDLLQGIQDDSIWLINLVENLLSVSRLDSEEVNLKTEPQLLEELTSEALAHVSKAADKHKVLVEIADPLLMAQVDATLLVQVLVNLIDNAVKYTPAGSEVRITAVQSGNMVRIRVADNGPGIRDADKGAIFDMFFTAGGKKGDNRRGLGLGLALCKSIIDAHKGSIEVKDNKPTGAVFEFTLPLAEVKPNENFYSGS